MNERDASSPSLVLLFGPPAVGKMTVGQALERITGFRLFHVHQVIDLVTQYFPFSTSHESPYHRLVVSYRRQFFEEAAGQGLSVVSTEAWRFPPVDEEIRGYMQPFLERDGRVYFVELTASLETRLVRNVTENRRRHKRVDWSTEEYLRRDAEMRPYHRSDNVPLQLPYLHIQTDELSAEATAQRICEYFGLRNPAAPSWSLKGR